MDRPFLSLMPTLLPELKQLTAPCRLEQIAAYLVKPILEYQKEGPYYLGGWSASGMLAYETARQLVERGHEVALLVMFDTANPLFQHSVLENAGLDGRAKKIKFLLEELLRLNRKDAPAYVTEKVKELRRKIETSARQIQFKVRGRLNGGLLKTPEQIVHFGVSSYRPAPYTSRLCFFKAAERPLGDSWDLSRGWRHLVTGEFEVYEVPGDHQSMFLEPNVETLAIKMNELLLRPRIGKRALC
jgi:thioesterase domain-containing protein